MTLFRDRREAGRLLARRLGGYSGRTDVVVLALPRGGVPVAREIARALGLPLDIFLVRKLGVPGYEELAMGAIASSGATVLDRGIARAYDVPDEDIRRVAAEERRELDRREKAYRGDRPPLDLAGRTLILVDDGLATGSSMRAALAALERVPASRIVVAVPVAPRATVLALEGAVDELVCLATPEPFLAVGNFYDDFRQVTDAEVRDALEASLRNSRREVNA